jgi:pimeloyl-ACP methyl ester carboxylesterase
VQTVVLLHGLLCDDSIWQHQVAGLGDIADVVVPVYRSATSLDEMAGTALASVTGRIALAGHSMGARVALEMWRSAPERITRLALFDFGVVGVSEGEHAQRRALTALSAEQGMGAVAQTWVASMVRPESREDASLMTSLHAMVETYTPAEHAAQVEALLNRRDLWSLLPTITVPTLVAVGRQDPWRGVDHHREIAAAIPGSRFEVIEDCGHMAPAEQPEVVLELLRGWLGA